MALSKWQTLDRRVVYRTPVFDLTRRQSIHPRRGRRDFFVLEAPAWVNIIPLTPANEVVMIRQFRHGTGAFTLEIPGGMVDPEDRSPRAAARREMREECGYDSRRIKRLGRVHPNPAIQPNCCYSYLARDVRPLVRPPAADGTEEFEVLLVPTSDVSRLITTGGITHALVIAAFSFFFFQ